MIDRSRENQSRDREEAVNGQLRTLSRGCSPLHIHRFLTGAALTATVSSSHGAHRTHGGDLPATRRHGQCPRRVDLCSEKPTRLTRRRSCRFHRELAKALRHSERWRFTRSNHPNRVGSDISLVVPRNKFRAGSWRDWRTTISANGGNPGRISVPHVLWQRRSKSRMLEGSFVDAPKWQLTASNSILANLVGRVVEHRFLCADTLALHWVTARGEACNPGSQAPLPHLRISMGRIVIVHRMRARPVKVDHTHSTDRATHTLISLSVSPCLCGCFRLMNVAYGRGWCFFTTLRRRERSTCV